MRGRGKEQNTRASGGPAALKKEINICGGRALDSVLLRGLNMALGGPPLCDNMGPFPVMVIGMFPE